jgi:hypothetical protein
MIFRSSMRHSRAESFLSNSEEIVEIFECSSLVRTSSRCSSVTTCSWRSSIICSCSALLRDDLVLRLIWGSHSEKGTVSREEIRQIIIIRIIYSGSVILSSHLDDPDGTFRGKISNAFHLNGRSLGRSPASQMETFYETYRN